jgi:hypothetical protein
MSDTSPKCADGLVSPEAILHVFAKASGKDQREYMLNVGAGIMELQRLDLKRYTPMSVDEAHELWSGELRALYRDIGPREALLLTKRLEGLILKKMGLAS